MANSIGKENIADGLVANASFKAPALSPKKPARKTRSKSIGPGGLGELEPPALKESNGNRRKSAFIPAVKSILSSNDEDEKKRREARRKSLARRRVSFAPEATLHTWDVVEYLRDATSSSASSDATRRASNITQASNTESPAPVSDPVEPPSTPPEQVEEPQPEPSSSPANQRAQHQKKNRRRSSGIPPMNFNNPDDLYSSSPLSGDNQSPGANDDESASEDEVDATEKLDTSADTEDSSQSSARLDAALRQASAQAGTQKLDLDDEGDMTMDIAEDEITASFKPWAKKNFFAQQDQENVEPSPFSPTGTVAEGDDGMSMDITRAVGRIVPQQPTDTPSSDIDDDMSMELTMPLGSIQAMSSNAPVNRRKSLKRRVSMLDASQGSPAKRPASRRVSLRQRRRSEENASEDATMDLTMAIGGIKNVQPSNASRRESTETTFEDATMDFTLAVGSIKNGPPTTTDVLGSDIVDEDLSMEFTKIVGPGIRRLEQPPALATPEKSALVAESKTPTPRKTPKKSPGRRRSNLATAEVRVPEVEVQATPEKTVVEAHANLDPSTPEIVRQKDIEEVEPSPFVRRTPVSASKVNGAVAVTTPTSQRRQKAPPMTIPDDPIAAPILNRRRSSLSSVQFSPLNVPREERTLKSTALLSNNIKLLSTPRKQTLLSPVKRGMTPKKSQTPQKQPTPKQKTPTPKKATTPRKSMSPRKRVAFGEEPVEEEEEINEDAEEGVSEVERISLQEFLDMTKIRFMDLSTTKRRHTAAPAAFHDVEVEEKEESLDRYVVAGACTVPEYELYQHACHEMKKYISDGRHFVRTMEGNVLEENPLLFSEYLTAPPDQRTIMDNQFKNLKTNARLEARGEWYTWRSTLLQDLKSGLLHTLDGFKRDETNLANQAKILDAVLPALTEKHETLSKECKMLQQRHDELNSCDREELEQAREQLVATDAELEERKQLLAQLQQELADKEARIEAVKERKIECVHEIKAAERVREECRGWSTTEVNELKAKVTALEQAHGWSIASASSTTITMTHLNDLELYFQPSAFATGTNTPNASISLAYIGDSASPRSRPLTTSKRFFLQLIRAHLHCIPQAQTSISSLLTLVKNSWAVALAVAEGVCWLDHSFITEEFILSDERMGIAANMLLPSLQTKVKVTFEVGAGIGKEGVETEVGIKAEVVYGEKYGEEKMGAFMRDFCGAEVAGQEGMSVWADAMGDLAIRLRKTGRKGERK